MFVKKIVKTNFDFEIIEASGGNDALDKIKQKPVCILMDQLMPDLTGAEVLEKMKKLEISIPVIFISADIQNSTKERCIELGAINFLNKPPNEDLLVSSIKHAILPNS